MNINVKKRELADSILTKDDLTSNQKLFLVSQIYKSELKRTTYLYYAFLQWKDENLTEIYDSGVVFENYLNEIDALEALETSDNI